MRKNERGEKMQRFRVLGEKSVQRVLRVTLFSVSAFLLHCGSSEVELSKRPEILPSHPSHEMRSLELVCPAGTQAQGEAPPIGLEQSCVKTSTDGQQILHGPYRSWFGSQIKESEGEYRDGLRQGVWYFWYPNKMPESKGFYDQGKRQGEWVFYVSDSETYRHILVTYRDDLEQGPWRSMHLAAPGVEPRFVAEEGLTEGGKRHGLWKSYYPSGHRYAEGEYVYGELQGPAKFWHESGKLREEGVHEHGLRAGGWTEWDETATRYRKGVYAQGKKEGTWNEYDENDHIVKVATYKNGELIAIEDRTPAQISPTPPEKMPTSGDATALAK